MSFHLDFFARANWDSQGQARGGNTPADRLSAVQGGARACKRPLYTALYRSIPLHAALSRSGPLRAVRSFARGAGLSTLFTIATQDPSRRYVSL